jgi:hypothetical protein
VIRRAAGVLVAAALLAGSAGAATVDPAAIALQLAIKHQLQLKLNKAVPGMKVKTVSCTVSKNGVNGKCKATFAYKTIRGYYTIVAKQPPKGQVSWSSTSVVCFNAKSGVRTKCSA